MTGGELAREPAKGFQTPQCCFDPKFSFKQGIGKSGFALPGSAQPPGLGAIRVEAVNLRFESIQRPLRVSIEGLVKEGDVKCPGRVKLCGTERLVFDNRHDFSGCPDKR